MQKPDFVNWLPESDAPYVAFGKMSMRLKHIFVGYIGRSGAKWVECAKCGLTFNEAYVRANPDRLVPPCG